MGIFDKLFGGAKSTAPTPAIEPLAHSSIGTTRLGRFTDAYKTDAQNQAWAEAITHYEQGRYLPAYYHFLLYLKHGANIHITHYDTEKLEADIYQGSKRLQLHATPERISSEVTVVKPEQLSVAWLRRLLEQNFDLKYARFALDPQQQVCMRFDSLAADGSPYKIYFALREMAIQADRCDDLLIAEFSAVHRVDSGHIQPVSTAERQLRYEYLQRTIGTALDYIATLDEDAHAGGIAYLLLYTAYRLDYIVCPEGVIRERLERIHSLYFQSPDLEEVQKNRLIIAELQYIQQRTETQVYDELYHTLSTFGITKATGHEGLVELIRAELHNTRWYLEEGQLHFALAVSGFVAGYTLFNFAPPQPDYDLLRLLFRVLEQPFFERAGSTVHYWHPDGSPFARPIVADIQQIVQRHQQRYPNFRVEANALNFSSTAHFAHSLLEAIAAADLTFG